MYNIIYFQFHGRDHFIHVNEEHYYTLVDLLYQAQTQGEVNEILSRLDEYDAAELDGTVIIKNSVE